MFVYVNTCGNVNSSVDRGEGWVGVNQSLLPSLYTTVYINKHWICPDSIVEGLYTGQIKNIKGIGFSGFYGLKI